MLGRLNRVIIYVGDVLACAAWYQQHFGFTLIGEASSEWAELDAGGCRLAFHQAYSEEGGPMRRSTGSSDHPHKLVFTVPDVDAAREHLLRRGVSMGELVHLPDYGNLTLCDGADLEGHRFQLCSR